MIEEKLALRIIESLRRGIPPKNGVKEYSVGNEELIEGIKKHLLPQIEGAGNIRFISGSWGAGKTHFFRLLKEIVLESGFLVSNVELNANEATMDKFEKIFYSIIRNISTGYQKDESTNIDPFQFVLKESLVYLSKGVRNITDSLTAKEYENALKKLTECRTIDLDFKRMVLSFWETFIDQSNDQFSLNMKRDEILQWFRGEGLLKDFKKKYSVSKMITRENAKIMLESLAGFVRLSDYKGLVILFDEAEQSYSVMRRTKLKEAHNNLLSLINNIEKSAGLFLIYATTPDFYTDPKQGIDIYGALAQRIGKPENKEPKAVYTIWNMDMLQPSTEDYQTAALKIRDIYVSAYSEDLDKRTGDITGDKYINGFVEELKKNHPNMSSISFWRILVSGLVKQLDAYLEGEEIKDISKLHNDIMEQLKED